MLQASFGASPAAWKGKGMSDDFHRLRNLHNHQCFMKLRLPSSVTRFVDVALPNNQTTKHGTGKHVLSTQQFNRESLEVLFRLADYFKLMVKSGTPIPPFLQGKHLACVFMEPSTRTSSSFQSAMLRLGGTTIQINEAGSSSEKGETLEDTIRCLESYSDALVLRHPEKGAAARAAAVCQKSILNAGDGVGEHPTQALLDMFTIRSELLNGKKIFNTSDASGFEVRTDIPGYSLAHTACRS